VKQTRSYVIKDATFFFFSWTQKVYQDEIAKKIREWKIAEEGTERVKTGYN
jgi:hypothetical protein